MKFQLIGSSMEFPRVGETVVQSTVGRLYFEDREVSLSTSVKYGTGVDITVPATPTWGNGDDLPLVYPKTGSTRVNTDQLISDLYSLILAGDNTLPDPSGGSPLRWTVGLPHNHGEAMDFDDWKTIVNGKSRNSPLKGPMRLLLASRIVSGNEGFFIPLRYVQSPDPRQVRWDTTEHTWEVNHAYLKTPNCVWDLKNFF